MKREYAQRVNSLLEHFHYCQATGSLSGAYGMLLRSGLTHLYFLAVCSGEQDGDTLSELRRLITVVIQGSIPEPYNLSDQPARPDTGWAYY